MITIISKSTMWNFYLEWMLLLLLLLPCEMPVVRPRYLLPTATFTRAHIVLSLKAVNVCKIYFYTGLCPHRYVVPGKYPQSHVIR